MRSFIRITFFATVLFLFSSYCPHNYLQDSNQINENKQITYRVISSVQRTFGYDILVKNKVFIHQPQIPTLMGNEGFRTKADAKKVCQLVVYKLTRNLMPPTISRRELDSLKIKY